MERRHDILTVGVVNFRPVLGKKENNLARIEGFITAAASRGAELIVLPELCLTGYGLTDEDNLRELAEMVHGSSSIYIAKLTAKLSIYAVFGLPTVRSVGSAGLYDTAVLCGPDGIVGACDRDSFTSSTPFCGGSGPDVFDTKWGKIGLSICRDSIDFQKAGHYAKESGARLIVNLAALALSFRNKKGDDICGFYKALYDSVETNRFYVVTANLAGKEKIVIETGGSDNIMGDPQAPVYSGGSLVAGPGFEKRITVYTGSSNDGECGLHICQIDLTQAGIGVDGKG